MKRIIPLLSALAALTVVAAASAANPPTGPFPGKLGGVFVSTQTVTSSGAISSSFAPGSVVVFRAYAVDRKTHKLLTKKTKTFSKRAIRSFYVQIPYNGPNVQLKYLPKSSKASGPYRWIGSWKVPSTYPVGVVPFTVRVKTWTKRTGSFVQMPVGPSQLTITMTPQEPYGPPPTIAGSVGSTTVDVALYADTVNGTHPAGAPPRPVGCTQTNVWKRGEQLVVRAFGYDLNTGKVLSSDNVTDAHFSVPGQSNIPLNWGAHGPAGDQHWYWTNAWNIPADYPLGDVNVHISFTTLSGKLGTIDYPISIIP